MITFEIGKTYKQSSGWLSTIIGTFIDSNNETIFVASTNRPNTPYFCYWDTGNCYYFDKDDNSTNYTIRLHDIIKDK